MKIVHSKLSLKILIASLLSVWVSCGIDTTSMEPESEKEFVIESELSEGSSAVRLQEIIDLLEDEGVPDDQKAKTAKEILAESLNSIWIEFENPSDTLSLIPNNYLVNLNVIDSLVVLECTSLLGPGVFEWEGEVLGQYVNLILLESRNEAYSLRIYEGEWLCVQKEFRKEIQ